ncbi:uncharacterized protein PADG_06208 [Paracoccidioides brasiliensis Pb18]|uniref:Methyltransferase domain-containing protein n=1 Tax=Paracoccidioides brasiliensis (strain Pb18) TaxID=502780 RepID=C1GGY9_PARBD|nr:uncharacterized protein PADG_06208 [Paracoccidioides brasiliensis Pb18]EEH50129.1 hypothetical protein PADG_06208 [Paracoccidioides brasiliensis Pb18]
MPRLPPPLLRHVYSLHPLLPPLLRECRDLPSAQNELRWLGEHALAECRRKRNGGRDDRGDLHREERSVMTPGRLNSNGNGNSNVNACVRRRLREMVRQRARGVPLQYILGDQPFGELEILCRRGVLIPRPETESYTTRTANLLLSKFKFKSESQEHPPALRILDLCTGTGCIPLLLHSLLAPAFPQLQICGVDISARALELARENLEHNVKLGVLNERARKEVSFIWGDVLSDLGADGSSRASHGIRGREVEMEGMLLDFAAAAPSHRKRDISSAQPFDNGSGAASKQQRPAPRLDAATDTDTETKTVTILLSNPPYISPSQFRNGTTSRSVRMYEPKLALVPPPTRVNADVTRCVSVGDSSSLNINATTSATTSRQEEIQNAVIAARQEDAFYPRILALGCAEWVDADLVVLECGDKGQAGRVGEMARVIYYGGVEGEGGVEVWRCDVDDEKLQGKDWEDGAGARAIAVRRRI